MSRNVKEDSKPVADSIQEAVLTLCRQNPEGVTNNDLKTAFPSTKLEVVVEAINALLCHGSISVSRQGSSGNLVYRATNPSDTARFRGLGPQEMLVYQLIKHEGNMGIWTRDLRLRSSLPTNSLSKILRALETRKLIKAVKSIAHKNKRVYMLFELEPSQEVTGGAWYTNDREFDTVFIDLLMEQCYKLIRSKGYATVEQVSEFIKASGISKVELGGEDIQAILNTLVYDGKVEECDDPRYMPSLTGRREVIFKPAHDGVPFNHFTEVPCAICPVFNQCGDEGDITPMNCTYLSKWLEEASEG